MPVTPDTLRTHLDYTSWASNLLLDRASQLSEGELNRDFATADKSVLGTLTHVFSADRIWIARLHGEPPEIPRGYDLARLRSEWGAVLSRWKAWAAGLTDASIRERISYRDLAGNPWITPIWQIVLHVVNHGTHHRGQVAGFLRAMGHPPPTLDLIAYYRTLENR